MKIRKIEEVFDKQNITRQILEKLPQWFGIQEAREEYIAESQTQTYFAAFDEEVAIGFLFLKQTGKATVEVACMGVLPSYQHQGVGKALFAVAKNYAKLQGYSFLQVKTVQMGHYDFYDETNRFYQNLGFKELEVFPTLWDPQNPCQIYIMAL